MSTYWGYVCQSHDPELESDHWFNHGDDELRAIFADREALLQAADSNYGMGLFNTRMGAPVEWLRSHPRCVVALRNEYGATEPLAVGQTSTSTDDGGKL